MGTTNTLDLNNRVASLEKAVSGGDSAQANKADIATEFNTTTNYTAGCFVYYGGKLYQFNADHTAGAWDPTDVVEANVTDQIVSNKAAIDGLTASDIGYDNTDSWLSATDVQGAVDELTESYPANKVLMSDGVTSVEDALESKSTVLVKNITVTLTPSTSGITIGTSTGIATNKILSVYLIYSDDVYYLTQIDKFAGIVYSIDESNGDLVIVAPPDKRWGDVTAQRILKFRVAYLM